MRRLLLLAAFSLPAAPAEAAEIRLGSLSLDWPAGYTLKSTQSPFELAGPGGIKALVTVMRPKPGATATAESLAGLQASLEGVLTGTAAKSGRVVLPLGTQTLPDGTRLQFIGSERSGLFQRSFLLQYALLSRSGALALVTFEGAGEAVAEHEGLLGLFSTTQWGSGEGSPAEQAAFTERVASLLRTQLGDAAVEMTEPLTLKIGGTQANLDRVNTFCRANAAGCDAELARYVSAVVDMQKNAALPPTRTALRAVVRPTAFADGPAGSLGGRSPFIRRPLAEGLVALVMLDSPRSARLVSEADAQALGLSVDDTYAEALAQLRRQLTPMATTARPVAAGRLGVLEGDFYESGRVLLHDDWAPLARAQKGVLVVALPAKNLLLYGADDSPAGLDALRLQARDLARRSPAPLTELLLRWTPEGWQAVR
ncbi:MAG: hypothetical protein K9J82_03360 [Methylotenera sp.]|nr:hypothetical protein [Methylotenera sp.]